MNLGKGLHKYLQALALIQARETRFCQGKLGQGPHSSSQVEGEDSGETEGMSLNSVSQQVSLGSQFKTRPLP